MKLLKMKLQNFKGIKNFNLDTHGQSVAIYGDNATGKTSLFDAYSWLLFGKDSQNQANFEIKTLDTNNKPIHGLEHEVEGVFEAQGKAITLKKVYKEVWTKRRGEATKTFTGHTTDHFLNGVPASSKKEYDERIAQIIDEDIFRLLSGPTYFNEQLHWQERREILLQVCGDITDEDVIASDKSLARLPTILGDHSLDDYRKIIQSRRQKINKEIEMIPVRIDEATQALPDVDADAAALEKDIAAISEIIKEKNQEFARLEAGGEVAEKTKQLREIEAEILDLRLKGRSKQNKEIQSKQEQVAELRGEILLLESNIESMANTNSVSADTIASLTVQMNELRDRWHQVNNTEYAGSDTCPTCGQNLPIKMMQEARNNYNRDKAERLEAINNEGKKLKERVDDLKASVARTEQKIKDAQVKMQKNQKAMDAIKAQVETLRNDVEQREDPGVKTKLAEKAATIQEIEDLRAGNDKARTQILADIQRANTLQESLEEDLLSIGLREKGMKRIEELKEQERELAAEYERLEQELYLTEQFVKTKVSLLEEKINSRFKLARFKLFNTLVNGAVEECCETTYQGVPFSSLNNGARINVGLDIIRTLARHYNFYPPIFIDNREAVTSLIDMGDQQVISLIVSEADKELRVEVEEKKQKGVA